MASETEICNMALGRIGAKRINGYTDNNERNTQIVQCRLHYEQTRNALLRSHWWRFARTRVQLSQNTTAPDFEWSYAYDLPSDFLREWLPPWDDNSEIYERTRYTYSLEGKQLLSNESTMYLRYVRKVEDVTQFDPLFTEVFVLQLALKMVMPLSQDKDLYSILYSEMRDVMRRVRLMDKQETDTLGLNDVGTWNDSRVAGSGNPLKRYS